MPLGEGLNMASDMSFVALKISRGITHNMDDVSKNFEIWISGDRDSYSLDWNVDESTLTAGEYSSYIVFNLVIQSSLYGTESLKIKVKDPSRFYDKLNIPFGGPVNYETMTNKYVFLSASDA